MFNISRRHKLIIIFSCIILMLLLIVLFLIKNRDVEIPSTIYAHTNGCVAGMTFENKVLEDENNNFPYYFDRAYSESIVFDNPGSRNANLILSTSHEYNGFNSSKFKDNIDFEIISMERYVNGEREVLEDYEGKLVLVSLEDNAIYYYRFVIRFGEIEANYYLKIEKINTIKEG